MSTPAIAVNGGSLNGGSWTVSEIALNGSFPVSRVPVGFSRTVMISSRVYHLASIIIRDEPKKLRQK
jgi:hypothetical protein